jgi:cell division protein YceG involved in septum cleavage
MIIIKMKIFIISVFCILCIMGILYYKEYLYKEVDYIGKNTVSIGKNSDIKKILDMIKSHNE